jgi:hypothetical protein
MGDDRFERRIAEALGRPIDGACAVRPRGTLILAAVGAGVLAGIGGVLGGALGGGLGGGLGALIGFVIAARRARAQEPPLAAQMALALTADGFELHSMGAMGTKPAAALLAAPYEEVTSVELEQGRLSHRAAIGLRSGATVEIESGRYGIGAGGELLAALRARAAGESVRAGA